MKVSLYIRPRRSFRLVLCIKRSEQPGRPQASKSWWLGPVVFDYRYPGLPYAFNGPHASG